MTHIHLQRQWSKQLLFSFFVALVGVLLSTSLSQASTSQTSNRQAQVKTPPHFSYADTWNNIHPFLMFDGHITDPAAVAPRYDFVASAKWYNINAYRSANPNMFLTYYIPFHRDSGTFRDSTAYLTLSQWQATHPDYILYKCDRRTPAYEFDAPEIPLAFSNPGVLNYQLQTYAIPASQNGFDGIIADNLNMENLFGACGTYVNGKWVQRYNGKHDDPRWLADVVNWVTQMQQALHNLPHPMALILNLGYGRALTLNSAPIKQVLAHSDGILDEAGFTHYGTYPLTGADWVQAIQLSNIEQNQGKPFYIVNNLPVMNRANLQWALASYLMAKGHYSEVFISTTQNYGIDAWHNEYNAQIGTPSGPMFFWQNVYWRNYSNGLSIVNPSPNRTFRVRLSTSVSFVDLYGNAVGPTVVLPPHSGLVLLISHTGTPKHGH